MKPKFTVRKDESSKSLWKRAKSKLAPRDWEVVEELRTACPCGLSRDRIYEVLEKFFELEFKE